MAIWKKWRRKYLTPSLFETLKFDPTAYPALAEHGEVTIVLHVNEQNMIIEEETKATILYKGNEIFSKKGKELLQYMNDYYTNRKFHSITNRWITLQ